MGHSRRAVEIKRRGLKVSAARGFYNPAPFGPDLNLGYVTRIPAVTLAGLAGPRVEIVSFAFEENGSLADLRRTVHDLSGFRDRDVVCASGGSVKPGTYALYRLPEEKTIQAAAHIATELVLR